MPLLRTFHWLKHGGLWLYKLTTFAVLAAGFGFAALVLGLRYLLLPQIDSFRSDIEHLATRALGVPVQVARIDAQWDGLRPQLNFKDLRLADHEGRTALLLPEVHTTLSWRSLLLLQPVFHSLEIDRPTLLLRRDPGGAIWIAGFPLAGDADGEGFGNSLLRHRQIIVADATLLWQDAKLGAPDLTLTHVDLRIDSARRHHRFGLRAVPPAALASPLDVRGDLRGDRLDDRTTWAGRMYVELGYTDLARWRPWLPPFAGLPSRGSGAIRAWVDVGHGNVEQATGDIRLADVLMRLGDQLAELSLLRVNGRVGWKRLANGFEVSSQGLVFSTPQGSNPSPLDLAFKRVPPGPGEPGHIDLRANALDLALLTAIADRLPVEEAIRRELVAADPQGSVRDLDLALPLPFDRLAAYRVKGRFDGLALRPGPLGLGIAGLGGVLEASDRGGTIALKSHDLLLDAPTVFQLPLAFETFDAQAAWTVTKNRLSVRVANLAFANRDIAGSLKGNFDRDDDAAGIVDVNGALGRLDPQVIERYLPVIIGTETSQWLDHAFVGGRLSDAKFKVRGNVAQFPWPDGKNGQFSVQVRVDDVDLQFAEDWPRIDRIKGLLSFQGAGMEVSASEASIAGVPLTKIRGVVKDLFNGNERLDIVGEAAGPTTQFLDFIEQSPVGEMIGHFNRDVRAAGSGKLGIKLDVPLRASRDTRVVGSYQFVDNRLVFEGDVPPIEQVNAKLEFTDTGIKLQNGSAVTVGGPLTVNVGTQGGAVSIQASGRADLDAFRRQSGDSFWLQYFRGGAAWRGSIVLRQGLTDYQFESDLQGVGSTLPAPLFKAPATAVATRFERRGLGANDDRIEISYGSEVTAGLERRRSKGTLIPVRGMIALGVPLALPEGGLTIAGTAREINVTRWQTLLEDAPAGTATLPLSAIDLTVEALQVLRRPFKDMRVKASLKQGMWKGTLAGPEIAGDFSYVLQDNGKLTARLTRLTLPATDDADRQSAPGAAARSDVRERPPDLDVIADGFRLGNKDFGRLEVNADLEGEDWRIDRIRLDNPDANLSMTGQWRSWLAQPRTDVNVELNVVDAGRFLKRLGYPEGIKGGKSKITGKLDWNGKPQDLDLATLSGELKLETQKGQFLKLEPGIAKLLGVISLQSLPRRLTLDFGDIFSTGLSFDGISATVKIVKGIASTSDFVIRSPSASIGLSGDVNLAAETQNLRVRVVPYLGEGVAIGATALGGPIAGVAALALQKILRDPVGQMMAFEYAVTGTWADPEVSKIDKFREGKQNPPG